MGGGGGNSVPGELGGGGNIHTAGGREGVEVNMPVSEGGGGGRLYAFRGKAGRGAVCHHERTWGERWYASFRGPGV